MLLAIFILALLIGGITVPDKMVLLLIIGLAFIGFIGLITMSKLYIGLFIFGLPVMFILALGAV